MEDCHEPAGPSHQAMKLFIRLTRMQRSVIGNRVKETGIYQGQHQILMHIHCHPGASQKDIAGMMEVSTATIAVALKKLERAGYIRRAVDGADNRYNRLQITEKGQRIVCQSHKILQRTEEEMFDGFEEGDFRQLRQLLGRICQNIERMSEKDGRRICLEPFMEREGRPAGRGPEGQERPEEQEGPAGPARDRESEGST